MKMLIALLPLFAVASAFPQQNQASIDANRLLQSIADTLSQKTNLDIEQFFADNFSFQGCSAVFHKKEAVQQLKSLPPGTKFQFTLLHADIYEPSSLLRYTVKITGFGPEFQALYFAAPTGNNDYPYVLVSGSASCPRRRNFY